MRSEIKCLPAEFLERLRRIVPSAQFDAITDTFTQNCPTTFRVNTLHANPEEVEEHLRSKGFNLLRLSWYPQGFILKGDRLRDLQQTTLYRDGAIYVQSLSSMIPVLILDPQPGEHILDLAAAPGSKTTQIAAHMQAKGTLIANDAHRVRSYRLKANLKSQGAAYVQVSVRPGETFGHTHRDTFDRVLLDAPCSTEGRFNLNNPASYRYWKPSKIHEMAHKQKRLLGAAIAAAKPGGIIVYATCTFAPEENEAVLQWALERFGDMVAVEAIRLPVPNTMPGLTRFGDKEWSESLQCAMRILPTAEMEAFFIARLRKSAASVDAAVSAS